MRERRGQKKGGFCLHDRVIRWGARSLTPQSNLVAEGVNRFEIWDLRFEILDWSLDPTDKFGGQVSSDTGFLFLGPESAKKWIRGLVSWMLSVNRLVIRVQSGELDARITGSNPWRAQAVVWFLIAQSVLGAIAKFSHLQLSDYYWLNSVRNLLDRLTITCELICQNS